MGKFIEELQLLLPAVFTSHLILNGDANALADGARVLRNTRVGELCLSSVLQASSNLSLGSDHELN